LVRCISYILVAIFLFSCQTLAEERKAESNIQEEYTEIAIVQTSLEKDTTIYHYAWKSDYDFSVSLINNINPPQGYVRIKALKKSFSAWLQHLPLNSDNTVYLHDGNKKYNQSAQFKVLDIDIGKRDLQQCADAVMRLRSEYLYSSNQFDKIHFNYTNGVNISFLKWSNGYYPSLKGNKVVWVSSSNNKSYKSFKKYMVNIFMYAGTASLEKELKSIPLLDIESGDVFIKGGFPGHAVTVLDVAKNSITGDKVFMIAQSYMPAQSIHILQNPKNSNFSPWYSLKEITTELVTPEWTFYPNQLKRFIE